MPAVLFLKYFEKWFTGWVKKFLWHYKRAKRDGQGARFLWRSFLHYTHLSLLITFDRKGVKMYCHSDPFSFWLWNHKDELRDDELFFERFLREGDVVIDAGANVGLLTLRASKLVGANGKVVSIEPHPETFQWLEKNIFLNNFSNIQLYNVAVGHKEQTVSFTNFKIKDVNKVSEIEGTIQLPMKTLDTLCAQVPRCYLLKIDVEGFELPALFGAEELLKRTDVIMFESSPRNFILQNYNLQDIFRYLSLQGFSIYKIAEDFEIEKVASNYETIQKYENLFATKNVEFLEKRLTH